MRITKLLYIDILIEPSGDNAKGSLQKQRRPECGCVVMDSTMVARLYGTQPQVGLSSDLIHFRLPHEVLGHAAINHFFHFLQEAKRLAPISLNAISNISHHNLKHLAGSQSDCFGGISYFPTSWRVRRTKYIPRVQRICHCF